MEVARRVQAAGGRAMLVGGCVRDDLLGRENKDIDLEIYGLLPAQLKALLSELGRVIEKGASFGVYGLQHSALDIAMPRRERCVGGRHTDFDVSVDPFLSFEAASMRRDFTINAMMRDALTGELIDCWGGRADLAAGIIRHVSPETFVEDPLRAFRAAQFAARLEARIAPETMAVCRDMDVTQLSQERVFEELCKALMKAPKPSVFFRALDGMDHLKEFFPELMACIGVEQNPAYHPEGDVFEHTMLVVDSAAALRDRALQPLAFMLAALFHDLGKVPATRRQPDGRITAYGHEVQGMPLCRSAMGRLTSDRKLTEYVVNMMWLHMRPNMMARSRSKKRKTRAMFDLSLCPEDLILLTRADATGKLDAPYDPAAEAFLRERLADYRQVVARPMVTGQDLIDAGLKPGPVFSELLARARTLHFAGLERRQALRQVLAEAQNRRP